MQSVGELNQNNADVFGHRHRHLLEVFSLLFFFAFEVNVRELGYAVDQVGNNIAKLGGQCGFRDAGIFNNVVQHRCHQALMVEVHFSKDVGDCQGMNNVGLAAAAALPFMCLFRVKVGTTYLFDLTMAQILGKSLR